MSEPRLIEDEGLAARTLEVRAGWWFCPNCRFRRCYSTPAGAMEGIGKHLLNEHGVRLALPRRHHGGLYGAGR